MDLTRAERARAAIRWYSSVSGKTQTEIGIALGYPNRSVFSQILNGHKDVPSQFPEKVASLDSRINIDFLLGSSDELLTEGTSEQPAVDKILRGPAGEEPKGKQAAGVYMPPELVQMFSDLSTTIKDQQATINKLIDTIIAPHL